MPGVVEFGGLTEKRSNPADRSGFCCRQVARQFFPNMQASGPKKNGWVFVLQPSDSLPLIGQVRQHRGIYAAFGHHHIGLTGGPKDWAHGGRSDHRKNVRTPT